MDGLDIVVTTHGKTFLAIGCGVIFGYVFDENFSNFNNKRLVKVAYENYDDGIRKWQEAGVTSGLGPNLENRPKFPPIDHIHGMRLRHNFGIGSNSQTPSLPIDVKPKFNPLKDDLFSKSKK